MNGLLLVKFFALNVESLRGVRAIRRQIKIIALRGQAGFGQRIANRAAVDFLEVLLCKAAQAGRIVKTEFDLATAFDDRAPPTYAVPLRLDALLGEILQHAVQLQSYRRTLATSQVFDLFGGVFDVSFIETPCAQQRRCALRPFDEIGFV